MSTNIRINKICQHCDNEFIAKTTVTKYCSDTCAKRAYKIRKREEKINKSVTETEKIKELPYQEIKAKEFLSINEVCKLVGISRRTVYRLIDREQLKRIKLGSRTIIRRSDLDSLLFTAIAPENLSTTHQKEPPEFDSEDSYTIKEIQDKYGVSEKALHDIIARNGIQKVKRGWYTYVPKTAIDEIFNVNH